MNDKPLRHEDYLAMAEENRRLKAQLEQITEKINVDKEPKLMTRKFLIGLISILLVGISAYILHAYNMRINKAIKAEESRVFEKQQKDYQTELDNNEKKQQVKCYYLEHEGGLIDGANNHPWQPYYIWAKWDSRHSDGWHSRTDKRFFSKKDADDFIKEYNVKICPPEKQEQDAVEAK